MSIYWIARARVDDKEQYAKYYELAKHLIQDFGGRMRARGGNYRVLEGTESFDRFIVAEFDSFEIAEACFNSQAYQNAAVFRRDGGGEVEIWLVEALNDSETLNRSPNVLVNDA